MPNKELADWQKIVIMATAPFFGNRTVADKADCSVWAVRKYRNKMKDEQEMLALAVSPDDDEVDFHEYDDAPFIDEHALEALDDIVQEGLEQDRGRI